MFPVLKRTWRLLLRSHNRASVKLLPTPEISKLITSNVIQLNIQSTNSLFVKVEGRYFPILSDHLLIKLKLPIKRNQSVVKIKAIGLFTNAKINVPIHTIEAQIETPSFPELKDENITEWQEPKPIVISLKQFNVAQNKLVVPTPNFELPDLSKNNL